jgi:hypothetical protein
MRALSSGTRAAVASLQDRLVSLEEENRALRDSVATQLQTQAETNRILTTIANQLQSLTTNKERRRQDPPPPPQEESAAAETAPGAAVVEEPPAAAAAEAAPAGRLAPACPALRRPPPPPVARRQEPNDQDQALAHFRATVQADALGALRATPRQPTVGTTCPSSWTTCLSQWRTLQLESFRDRPQTEWDRSTRCRYNKRLLIMKQIERASEGQLMSLNDAATYLDKNRADMSINFTAHLKSRSDGDERIPKRVAADPALRRQGQQRQPARQRGRRQQPAAQQQQQEPAQQPPRRPPPRYNPIHSQGHRAMAEVRRSHQAFEFRRLMARRNATLPQQFDMLNDSEVDFGRRLQEMVNDGEV